VNRRRVAALLRELADEIERAEVPSPAANDTRPKYQRRVCKASPEDVAQAAEVLKRRGVVPSGR
jgi:hypothetical protein